MSPSHKLILLKNYTRVLKFQLNIGKIYTTFRILKYVFPINNEYSEKLLKVLITRSLLPDMICYVINLNGKQPNNL